MLENLGNLDPVFAMHSNCFDERTLFFISPKITGIILLLFLVFEFLSTSKNLKDIFCTFVLASKSTIALILSLMLHKFLFEDAAVATYVTVRSLKVEGFGDFLVIFTILSYCFNKLSLITSCPDAFHLLRYRSQLLLKLFESSLDRN